MPGRQGIPELRAPHQKCETCPIRNRAVCSYSTPSQLSELEEAKFYRDFSHGQEIVSEGESTQAIGSIVQGVVALQKTLEDGRRQIVGLLFPGDFVGRPFRPIAPYDAVAATPVRMCMFHRSKFERIMAHNAELERRLLEMMLDELDASRDWMVLLGRKTAREKLATLLSWLARRHAQAEKVPLANGLEITLPLTRESIAEYLGLTIETVSRQFTQLRRDGVIDLVDRKGFIVADLVELSTLAGEDPGGFEDFATA